MNKEQSHSVEGGKGGKSNGGGACDVPEDVHGNEGYLS